MAATQISDIAATLFQSPRKEFLSFQEAALETTLSERTLRRLYKAGRLSARQIGGRLIISRESLDELIRSL